MSAPAGLETALQELVGCQEAVGLLAALPPGRLREPRAAEGYLLLVDGLRQRLELCCDELSSGLRGMGLPS